MSVAAHNNEKKIGFVYTHTRRVLCAYVYVYHYMRAEPVRLVRDRVEDRSSAATTNGPADGRRGIII